MKKKESKENKIFGISLILLIYILIVIMSKVIRYTVMKFSLVDLSRGDEILYQILYDANLKFIFSITDSTIAFNNTAVIFKAINFFRLSTYTQFEIYITILWNIIVILLILKLDKLKNNMQAIYLILTIAVLNIFNFTLAKEPVQFLYFLAIYYILNKNIKTNYKLFWSIFIILISTFTFRNYYILFAFFTCISYVFVNFVFKKAKKIKLIHILLCFGIIIGSILIFLIVAEKITPSSYYELLTVRTHSSREAMTKIRTLISGSTSNKYNYIIEYILIIFRMLFPFELLGKGVKYIFFIFYQLIITFNLLYCIKKFKKNDDLTNLSLCLYIGFILASATFEPDFGSWIRHEAVTFPIFLIIMDINRKKKGIFGANNNDKKYVE